MEEKHKLLILILTPHGLSVVDWIEELDYGKSKMKALFGPIPIRLLILVHQ
jgi:hypothetical protein